MTEASSAPSPKPGRQLRLALAMRGGVSLAVWIGGACGEIDELRRATTDRFGGDDDAFWRKLATVCGYDQVVVDVLTGASAGGLNSVLFGSAVANGFPMKELGKVWRRVASVDQLRRPTAPWISLFDGDTAFLDAITKELTAQVSPPARPVEEEDGSGPPIPVEVKDGSDPPIHVELTATLVEPLNIPTPSVSDEDLYRSRSSASFTFRRSTGLVNRDDFAPTAPELARLALAARATSSFPAAFEAAVVRSRRAEEFFAAPASGAGRLVDCGPVFSARRGARPKVAPPEVPAGGSEPASAHTVAEDDDFVVADGGIIDNIPLGRALDAIAAAPAGGRTKRVLVYLHPDGPPPRPNAGAPSTTAKPITAEERSDRRRDVGSVLVGALRARVQGETIDADIAQLERHNAGIRTVHALRAQTAARIADPTAAPPGLADWHQYVVQRSAADASRLRALLDDPVEVLGEDPFPLADGDDGPWLAPLARWDRGAREALDRELASAFAAALQRPGGRDPVAATGPVLELSPKVLEVGLAPLRRSVDLVLEWVRSQPDATQLAVKPSLYGLKAAVADLERSRRLAWVTVARRVKPADAAAVPQWCADGLAFVDALVLTTAPGRYVPTTGDESLVREAWNTHRFKVGQALDAVLRNGLPAPAASEPVVVDLRTVVLEELGRLVAVALGLPGRPVDDGSPVKVVDQLLRTPSSDLLGQLALLEVLTLAEHLSGARPGDPISFHRFSAVTDTPVAATFAALKAASDDESRRAGDEWAGREDFLRPEVKLAGNELSNFSAFLRPEWRDNDWMWGRLDAASGLVTLLVTTALDDAETDAMVALRRIARELGVTVPAGDPVDGRPTDAQVRAVRLALIKVRQEEVLGELVEEGDVDPGTGWQDYRVGLDTLTDPGGRDIQDTAVDLARVATNVLQASLPDGVRGASGPIGFLLRSAAWILTRPKHGRSDGAGPDGAASSVDRLRPAVRRRVFSPTGAVLGGFVIPLVVALVGVGVAWGVVASKLALLIGLGVGLLLSVVVLSIVVALSWWTRKDAPDRRVSPAAPPRGHGGGDRGPRPPPR